MAKCGDFRHIFPNTTFSHFPAVIKPVLIIPSKVTTRYTVTIDPALWGHGPHRMGRTGVYVGAFRKASLYSLFQIWYNSLVLSLILRPHISNIWCVPSFLNYSKYGIIYSFFAAIFRLHVWCGPS